MKKGMSGGAREDAGGLLESVLPGRRLLHLTLLWLCLLGQLLLFSPLFTSLEATVFPLSGLLLPVSAASAGAVSLQRRLAGAPGQSSRLQELWLFIHGAITATLAWTLLIATGALGALAWVSVTLIIIMLLFLASTLHSRLFDARAAFLPPLTLGLSWPLLIVMQKSLQGIVRLTPWVLDSLALSVAAAALLAAILFIYAKSGSPVPGRYSAVWAGALAMAALAPLHELLGVWANKVYGEVDRTLALTGFVVAAAAMTHFVWRSYLGGAAGAPPGSPSPGDLRSPAPHQPFGRIIPGSLRKPSKTPPALVGGGVAGTAPGAAPGTRGAAGPALLRAAALNEEGLACLRRGEHARALERFDRALELDPGLECVWTNRGTALLELGAIPGAIGSYNRALQLNDASCAAWINEGHALIDSGDPERALKCLERAIRLSPRSELAWSERGVALRRLGRAGEAEENFRRALTLNPGYAIAWNNRGNALMDRGMAEEAFHCYNVATIINPSWDIAWYNKACALLKSGRAQDAIRCFERSITASLERVMGVAGGIHASGVRGARGACSPGAVAQ